jgi:hypothetical protein
VTYCDTSFEVLSNSPFSFPTTVNMILARLHDAFFRLNGEGAWALEFVLHAILGFHLFGRFVGRTFIAREYCLCAGFSYERGDESCCSRYLGSLNYIRESNYWITSILNLRNVSWILRTFVSIGFGKNYKNDGLERSLLSLLIREKFNTGSNLDITVSASLFPNSHEFLNLTRIYLIMVVVTCPRRLPCLRYFPVITGISLSHDYSMATTFLLTLELAFINESE